MSECELTIDHLAAATKVPSRTIRFYQSKGLLPRPERRGRVAHYGAAHVERLGLVAQLQDRGLQIKAIRDLVGRIDKGELKVQDWLGLDDRLREPWADDEARIVEAKELAVLVGEPRPGRLADLVRAGLVARRGEAFLVPSPALLQLAIRLEAAGVDLDAVAKAVRLLRKRLSRAAGDLAEQFTSNRARRSSREAAPPLGDVVRTLRPIALDAVRLIFAQEMERVLRDWVDSGRAAKLGRRGG